MQPFTDEQLEAMLGPRWAGQRAARSYSLNGQPVPADLLIPHEEITSTMSTTTLPRPAAALAEADRIAARAGAAQAVADNQVRMGYFLTKKREAVESFALLRNRIIAGGKRSVGRLQAFMLGLREIAETKGYRAAAAHLASSVWAGARALVQTIGQWAILAWAVSSDDGRLGLKKIAGWLAVGARFVVGMLDRLLGKMGEPGVKIREAVVATKVATWDYAVEKTRNTRNLVRPYLETTSGLMVTVRALALARMTSNVVFAVVPREYRWIRFVLSVTLINNAATRAKLFGPLKRTWARWTGEVDVTVAGKELTAKATNATTSRRTATTAATA